MGIRIHRVLAGIAFAVGAVSVQAQGTTKIGLVDEATGPNAGAGVYTVNGAPLALAINNAKAADPESIRKGSVAIEVWKGGEETYSFGDKGNRLRGNNVVKNESGLVTFT